MTVGPVRATVGAPMVGATLRQRALTEIASGESVLQAAERMASAGLPNALARAFHGAMHFARALLIINAIDTSSERGVISILEHRFMSATMLPRESVSALARLSTYRPKGKESEQHQPDDLVKRELAAARLFADHCRAMLRTAGVLS